MLPENYLAKGLLIELTLFRLGYFGKIWGEGALRPHYHQAWHDGALGQNLSKALKTLLTSSL